MNKTEHNNAGYEKRDINALTVIGTAVGTLVVLVVIIIILMDYFSLSTEKAIYERQLRPESKDLRELRARETEILTSYKVLDRARGIYQIPIERSMQLLAEEYFQENLNNR